MQLTLEVTHIIKKKHIFHFYFKLYRLTKFYPNSVSHKLMCQQGIK